MIDKLIEYLCIGLFLSLFGFVVIYTVQSFVSYPAGLAELVIGIGVLFLLFKLGAFK